MKESLLVAGLVAVGLGATFVLVTSTAPKTPGLPNLPPPTPQAKPLPPVPAPTLTPSIPGLAPAGLFPDLAVGDHVIVDPTKTNMQPALQAFPAVEAAVDLVLQDKAVVSIRMTVPFPYAGTIPRSAILRVVPKPLVQNL